jgi:hypothetical protein
MGYVIFLYISGIVLFCVSKNGKFCTILRFSFVDLYLVIVMESSS